MKISNPTVRPAYDSSLAAFRESNTNKPRISMNKQQSHSIVWGTIVAIAMTTSVVALWSTGFFNRAIPPGNNNARSDDALSMDISTSNLQIKPISILLFSTIQKMNARSQHILNKIHYISPQSTTNPSICSTQAPFIRWQQQAENETNSLFQTVNHVLRHGGSFERVKSNGVWSGIYLIRDHQRQPIAIFKPDDERHWGPNCPLVEQRHPDPSFATIAIHKMKSIEQGRPSQRKYLAKLLDFGDYARLPAGGIAKITSDQFISSVSPSSISHVQKKLGYLEAWVPNAQRLGAYSPDETANANTNPFSQLSIDAAHRLENNPLLNQVPLDEFQKIAILDFLLYNEDGHSGNILVTTDHEGGKHLTPIDKEALLPWKLEHLIGLYSHERAKQPFTQASLQFISELEPNAVHDLVNKVGLPEQSAVNAKILTVLLKRFSAANLTLHDLYQFASTPASSDSTSLLWKDIENSSEAAENELSQEDREKFKYYKHLNWVMKSGKRGNIEPSGYKWLQTYNQEHKTRIEAAIEQMFWKNLNQRISSKINSFKAAPDFRTLI